MYQCPNCGGNYIFDIPSQQLACEHCGTKADPYALDDKDQALFEQQEYEATVFTCPQCGGEIISTDTSVAEFCSFCGVSTILHGRLVKEKRPKHLIPFQKTKEDCKKAYTNMMKKAIFAPDDLKDPRRIDSFRGIYMPYWAFHLTQKGPFSLSGYRSHRRGDYIIKDHYALSGNIDASYDGLSYDASSSFDDSISEKLAPYNIRDLKDFTPAYLSGFYADTADVPAENYQDKAIRIAADQSLDKLYGLSAFSGYHVRSANQSSQPIRTTVEDIDSTMYPVWFMSYRNGNRVAYTTVNGQTGKIVADIPIDTKKYLLGSLVLAVPIFILLNLFFTIKPHLLMAITGFLALLSCILYSVEINNIYAREKKNILSLPKKAFGLYAPIVGIILCIAIGLWNPVSDLFYYGAAILTMMAVFTSIKNIIYYYNILSTRRLPQFDKTGGDNRA